MKRLIIVRHGDTFLSDERPRRIGGHTDLPLVDTTQPKNIGRYFNKHKIKIDKVFAAPLKRTMQTAQLILDEMHLSLAIQPASNFIEIDYGIDENKIEEVVILRLGRHQLIKEGVLSPSTEEMSLRGKSVIDAWNNEAKVPHGWSVNVDSIIKMWRQFADQIAEGETVLVVSSNGIIRFAPSILDKKRYIDFLRHQTLKVKTSSIAIFNHENDHWECQLWNKRPNKNRS